MAGLLELGQHVLHGGEVRQVLRRGGLLAVLHDAALVHDEGRAGAGGAETEQVAFCTQNVVPGIGFSNDPLLQGRNFSYLDTQLKRLGSPNFTHLPINAPRCPVMNFQQDGHMAMRNPKGRVNYEPNSWGAEGGPRRMFELCFSPIARRLGWRPEFPGYGTALPGLGDA